jgi:hypothetical protein
MKTIVQCVSLKTESHCAEELTLLVEQLRGRAAFILLLPNEALLERCRSLNLLCVHYEEEKGKRSLRERLFEKILADLNRIYAVDAVHFHGNPYFISAARRSLPGVRILYSQCGAGESRHAGSSARLNLVRSIRKDADLVVASSEEHMMPLIEGGYPRERILLADNTPDPETFADIYGLPPG